MSWKESVPSWPADVRGACCGDAVVLAKLCAGDDWGLIPELSVTIQV